MNINVDGNLYKIKLGINQLIELEEETGMDLTAGKSQEIKIKHFRNILYHALKAGGDFKGSLSDAGDLIDKIGFIKAAGIIEQLFESCNGGAKAQNKIVQKNFVNKHQGNPKKK